MSVKKDVEPKKPVASEFAAKKIGVNFIATLKEDGKSTKYSKKVTPEETEVLKKKIELYNRKPSDTLKETIIKLLAPEAVKKEKVKEDLTAKVKGIKQQAKKATKAVTKVSKEEKDVLKTLEADLTAGSVTVQEAQAIVNKFKKVEEVKASAVISSYRRSGEY